MEFTAQQIAAYLEGTLEGNPEAKVRTFAKIEEGQDGALSFLANPKYTHYLYETASSVVLINADMVLEQPVACTLVRVPNAYEAIARLLSLYESMTTPRTGVHPLAFVSETASLGEDVYVGPFAYVGDGVVVGRGTQLYPHVVLEEGVVVGDDCKFYPNVSVYHGCRIGHRCILHSGAVIGADGFGFAPTPDGFEKIPQIGIVTLEDDVEIGANTCIDRSTMGSTYVRRGVKLDNLVQIAHNVEVGAHTVMSAQVGVAGSAKIGQWSMFGGQVGIAGHISLPDGTKAGAQAGIHSGRTGGAPLMGTPAIDARTFARSSAVFKQLPTLREEVRSLQKELAELRQQLATLTASSPLS